MKDNTFYQELKKSLLEAIEIEKGNIDMIEIKGMPAKTLRTVLPADAEKKEDE